MGTSSSKYGPANRNNFHKGVIKHFSEIIHQPYSKTLKDITRLRSRTLNAYPDHFLKGIVNLPRAHIIHTPFGGLFQFESADGLETITYITGGANGRIYKGNRTSNVYKEIIIDVSIIKASSTYGEYMEKKYKEIYLEAFIQSLLQNDPTYGHNIAKIEKLYCDIDTTEILYIKMEHINNMDIKTFLNSLKDVNGLVSFAAIKPMLRHLAVALDYFLKNYGFYHGDLHGGNVLFVSDAHNPADQIKIIDFGYSCMKSTDTGRTFSVHDIPCKSYDLLMYIMYLQQYYGDQFAPDALDFLVSLSQLPGLPAGNDLFNCAKIFLQAEGLWTAHNKYAIFHLMYSIKIDKRHSFWGSITPGTGSTMYDNFIPLLEQNFLPEGFIRAIDSYSPVATSSPATSATSATSATPSSGGRRKHTRRNYRMCKIKKSKRYNPS